MVAGGFDEGTPIESVFTAAFGAGAAAPISNVLTLAPIGGVEVAGGAADGVLSAVGLLAMLMGARACGG